ncbi:hypothetical protein HZS_1128 [Henneguya salminicola]|uniref:Actin-like protein C08B116 (Trinotate prediction) n=1 Tax=Henneguya salminicola TaxID=69463 RepID=A0A6G3MM78_HENSL|nr:hypothetical protein HZS_1128 [Henneguya salminicola]
MVRINGLNARAAGTKNVISRNKMAIVIDHGGYSIKIGDSSSQTPSIVENVICKTKLDRRATFIGNQYHHLSDKTSLCINRPIQKGYIINWSNQKEIWDYLFNSNEFSVSKIYDTSFILKKKT